MMPFKVLKIAYTRGDESTQPGGFILRERLDKDGNTTEYIAHSFVRDPGSKEPREFFWGHYNSEYTKAHSAYLEKENRAMQYDRGGALISDDRLEEELEKERRTLPGVGFIALKLGLDIDDATKVLEGSCVTREEFASDPEACWTRMRGAAEELCQHEFVESVDEDGNLIEPAFDMCIHCGERRD
jgi:hypothetical protein